MDFYYLPGKSLLLETIIHVQEWNVKLVFDEIFVLTRVGSAPCRAVQMTAAAVNADLNLKLLNLMTGEHMTPEFLKVFKLFNKSIDERRNCFISITLKMYILCACRECIFNFLYHRES